MVMNDMTDDGKWGASIPIVNGKRPEWLEDNEVITGVYPADFYIKPGTVDPAKSWAWNRVISIRLPASHPHYQQTQPIDWNAPIEAVHEDGRVVPAFFHLDDGAERSPIQVSWHNQSVSWCGRDGRSLTVGWRIRNVQPATGIPVTAQTLTAQERLERLEAFARRIASTGMPGDIGDEARALVAEMEPVVDGDLVEARKIAGDALAGFTNGLQGFATGVINAVRTGNDDVHPAVVAALAAIKRGRELARGDAA